MPPPPINGKSFCPKKNLAEFGAIPPTQKKGKNPLSIILRVPLVQISFSDYLNKIRYTIICEKWKFLQILEFSWKPALDLIRPEKWESNPSLWVQAKTGRLASWTGACPTLTWPSSAATRSKWSVTELSWRPPRPLSPRCSRRCPMSPTLSWCLTTSKLCTCAGDDYGDVFPLHRSLFF